MIASAGSRSGRRPAPRTQPASAFQFVLKAERDRRGWTQRQMAGHLGVSQSCVARWELGARHPTVAELERVGHLLNVVFRIS